LNLLKKEYDQTLIKEALGNLLKRKDYHLAPPIKKNTLLMRECLRLVKMKKI